LASVPDGHPLAAPARRVVPCSSGRWLPDHHLIETAPRLRAASLTLRCGSWSPAARASSGSHVARHLLDAGHDVVVLDDLSGGYEANVPAGATFVAGSAADSELVDELFRTNEFSHVFHVAAYAAEGLSHFIRRFNYTNNVLGSVSVLNAALRAETVERFVFTSSIAVYGPAQTPMSEDLVPEPEDPYGIAKYAVELDLRAAQRMFGLDYTIFRPHNVYRRAAAPRRPVPERDRDLHEPGHER